MYNHWTVPHQHKQHQTIGIIAANNDDAFEFIKGIENGLVCTKIIIILPSTSTPQEQMATLQQTISMMSRPGTADFIVSCSKTHHDMLEQISLPTNITVLGIMNESMETRIKSTLEYSKTLSQERENAASYARPKL